MRDAALVGAWIAIAFLAAVVSFLGRQLRLVIARSSTPSEDAGANAGVLSYFLRESGVEVENSIAVLGTRGCSKCEALRKDMELHSAEMANPHTNYLLIDRRKAQSLGVRELPYAVAFDEFGTVYTSRAVPGYRQLEDFRADLGRDLDTDSRRGG